MMQFLAQLLELFDCKFIVTQLNNNISTTTTKTLMMMMTMITTMVI